MTGQGLCRWRHWLPVIEAAALLMSCPVVTRLIRLLQSAVAGLTLRMRGFHPPLCFGIRRIDGRLVVCGGGSIDGLASFGPLPGGFPR